MEKLSMETWRSLTYQRIEAITKECPEWWSPKGRPLKTKERHQQVYELEKKLSERFRETFLTLGW